MTVSDCCFCTLLLVYSQRPGRLGHWAKHRTMAMPELALIAVVSKGILSATQSSNACASFFNEHIAEADNQVTPLSGSRKSQLTLIFVSHPSPQPWLNLHVAAVMIVARRCLFRIGMLTDCTRRVMDMLVSAKY